MEPTTTNIRSTIVNVKYPVDVARIVFLRFGDEVSGARRIILASNEECDTLTWRRITHDLEIETLFKGGFGIKTVAYTDPRALCRPGRIDLDYPHARIRRHPKIAGM